MKTLILPLGFVLTSCMTFQSAEIRKEGNSEIEIKYYSNTKGLNCKKKEKWIYKNQSDFIYKTVVKHFNCSGEINELEKQITYCGKK